MCMKPRLAFGAAFLFALLAPTTLISCTAQKQACAVIKLADDACVLVESPDGQQVRVPASELYRVALEAKMRSDTSANASSSAAPPAQLK